MNSWTPVIVTADGSPFHGQAGTVRRMADEDTAVVIFDADESQTEQELSLADLKALA